MGDLAIVACFGDSVTPQPKMLEASSTDVAYRAASLNSIRVNYSKNRTKYQTIG